MLKVDQVDLAGPPVSDVGILSFPSARVFIGWTHMAMGHNLWLHLGVEENPFASYFDVHQGYRILPHSRIGVNLNGGQTDISRKGGPGISRLNLPRHRRGRFAWSQLSCPTGQLLPQYQLPNAQPNHHIKSGLSKHLIYKSNLYLIIYTCTYIYICIYLGSTLAPTSSRRVPGRSISSCQVPRWWKRGLTKLSPRQVPAQSYVTAYCAASLGTGNRLRGGGGGGGGTPIFLLCVVCLYFVFCGFDVCRWFSGASCGSVVGLIILTRVPSNPPELFSAPQELLASGFLPNPWLCVCGGFGRSPTNGFFTTNAELHSFTSRKKQRFPPESAHTFSSANSCSWRFQADLVYIRLLLLPNAG